MASHFALRRSLGSASTVDRRPTQLEPRADAKGKARTRKPFHLRHPPWEPPSPPERASKHLLSDEEFEELECVAALSFSPSGRESINDAISLAASMGPDRDDNVAAAKAKAAGIEKLRKAISELRCQLRVVEESCIPGQHATLLELWQKVTGVRLPTGFWGPGPEVDRYIASLDRFAAVQTEALQKMKKKKGSPKRFQHLDTMICLLAQTYAREGGVPSAAYQDNIGNRETPFLRMLRFVNERLPASRRAATEGALDKRGSEVLSDMKRWRREMGFPSWEEQRKQRARKDQKSRL